jgi:hypothetical protein
MSITGAVAELNKELAKKRVMSAATKKKMSEATKTRWAAAKKASSAK